MKAYQQLAQLLNHQTADNHAASLAAAGLRLPEQQPERESPASSISIWQACDTPQGVVYQRPERGPFGDHFAADQRFALLPKPGRQRLCWFGESAAAGYLFAPHVTPAKCLATALGADWEVIDFARTNETIGNLQKTIAQAAVLQADVWVIYTGNNWNLLESGPYSPYTPQAEARFAAAQSLQAGGQTQLVEDAAARWFQKASLFLLQLSEWHIRHGVRVVLLGPAVNRSHWRSWQPFARNGQACETVYAAFEHARQALQHGDGPAAKQAALQLLKLTEWMNPTAYDLYGSALRECGDDAAADAAFRGAIDQAHGVTAAHLDSPRAGTMVRTLLERTAKQPGFDWLDLEQVLTDDAAHFADYCHLTPAAMIRLADQLCRILTGKAAVGAPTLKPHALATGYLGAALHSAHRYLGDGKVDWIVHWLKQAIAADRTVLARILDLIAMRLAGGDSLLHPAQQANAALSFPLEQQHGWHYPHVDAVFIQAAQKLFYQHYPEASTALDALLQQACWQGQKVRLLRYWLWEPLTQTLAELVDYADLNGHGFMRCLWPQTHFAVLLQPGCHAALELTIRTPEQSHQQVRISLNQQLLASCKVDHSWQRMALAIPAQTQAPGLQKLTIHWPFPQPDAAPKLTQLLAENRDADLHPVFGHIARCDVRVAAAEEKPATATCR